MDTLKTLLQLLVGVLVKRIQVGADGTREQDGILGNDGQARAQAVKTDLGNVDTINGDGARAGLQEAEESQRHGRLARTSTANDSDTLVVLDGKGDTLEDSRQVISVAHNDILHLNGSGSRPGGGRLGTVLLLRLELRVLNNALCSVHIQLQAGIGPDGKQNSVGKVKSKGHGETSHGSVGACHNDDDTSAGSEDRANGGHSDAHPAVEDPEVDLVGVPGIKMIVHALDVVLALLEGTQGGDTGEGGVEQFKNRRLGVTFEALHGSGAIHVLLTDEASTDDEDKGKRQNERGNQGGSGADGDNGQASADEPADAEAQSGVDDVKIGGHAVQDSANGDSINPA